jgi:uncharacterized protein YfiM (DUF2279 family)
MRVVILVFALHGGPTRSSADSWVGRDKLQHFFLSAFVQSISYGTLRGTGVSHASALAGASLTTAVVGVGKELHDRRVKGEFSVRDLSWDAAGAASMTVLLRHTAR